MTRGIHLGAVRPAYAHRRRSAASRSGLQRQWRRLPLFLATALVVTLGLAVAPTSPAIAGLPAGGMSASALNDMYRAYGDTSGRWNGGDSTASVLLPDGRLVWLFSDTFLGAINADGSRPRDAALVHNSMVVQDGTQLVETKHGGSTAFPTSLVGGDRDGEQGNAGYWTADGTVEGNSLRVLYNHYDKTGTDSLDVSLTGTWLATFALPSLTLQSLTDLQKGAEIAWGAEILEDGSWTYVYGTEFAPHNMRFTHLARVPAGGLGGTWQYWTGSTWSATMSDSARILSGAGTSFGVRKTGSQYVLVTVDVNLVFNPTVVAYTATSPTGPWTGPTVLYTAPEVQAGNGNIVYDARVHVPLTRSGKLLLSYNVNSLTPDGNYTDARIYRPRFVELDWPLPTPDPAALPPAPGNLVATPNGEGLVSLTWSASAGATGYWLYQRDVTAGQTHPARTPSPLTGTSAELATLRGGHTYEFSVSARNDAGEGARSSTVTVLPTVPRPPAPTGVTASTNTTGKVTVAWSAVPNVWGYQIFKRDVTLGQTTFEEAAKLDWSRTSQDLEWLAHGHEYEFYVIAENGGGQSAASAKVRVTVRYDLPPTPTGLVATPNSDGTITLNWTAPYPGLWYQVYQRDVTAGETELVQLPLPVSSGSTTKAAFLQHGHRYEFAVASLNGAGESARSAVVSATATFPVPPAVSGLSAVAGDGMAELSWTSTGPDHWYQVYQRDVTAGETGFTRLPLPVSEGTSMTAAYLTNNHTYEYKVAALGEGGVEGPLSAAVQVTPNVPKPQKPTGLTATPKSDGTIALSWTNPTPDVYTWVYQRDVTAGGAWQRMTYPVEGSTFVAAYLAHGHTYEFRVLANNSAGDGPFSDVVSALCTYSKPPAPSGLRGNTDGDGAIDLNWDAPSPNLYYWVYYRDVTAGESFQKTAYPTEETSATLNHLQHGHVYEFKVTAANEAGEGPASATIRVTSYGGLPAAPTNVTATAGDGKVTVRWTASATPNVYYWLEYRTAGGTWKRQQYPISTCCSAEAGYLSNGTTYEFRVRATNASGDSVASNVASAKPMPPLPVAPTGLSATPGDGKVNLSWTASATPNVYYWVEYRANGGSWQRQKYPDSTCCTATAGYLTNGVTYDFRVRATNLSGDSAASNVVSARPMPPFPQAPSGLAVTPKLGEATLKWTASPTANVYYWVEYRPAGGTWQRTKYPVTRCCTATAGYLTAAKYEFRVRATNLAGDSAPTATVTVTMPLPPAPTGLTADPAGPYEAKLKWNPVAGADGYIVYHGFSKSTMHIPDLKPLKYPVVGGNTSSFTAGYLLEPGLHWWAVAAVKYGRVGPKSGMDTMSPMMENWYHYEARWRYFDAGAPSKGSKAVTSAKKSSVDGGIIVARAWIAANGAYIPISDGFYRHFSEDPNASARIHVAWDTNRGQLGAIAQASCTLEKCTSALPVSFSYSSADDNTTVGYNYVWTGASTGDNLVFHWKATNSTTGGVPGLAAHIDTEVRLNRSSGSNYSAQLYTDHFPSYEVYQYPRYTMNGFPTGRKLTTCGQYNINGLYDSPSERRWC